MSAILPQQLRLLHVLAKQRGLDHDGLRDFAALGIRGLTSLSDLTQQQASQVLTRLRLGPIPAEGDNVAGWSDGAGRRSWRLLLATPVEWQDRLVSRIEWYAHPTGEVYAYADRIGHDLPPVDPDTLPTDWTPPTDWLDGWETERTTA